MSINRFLPARLTGGNSAATTVVAPSVVVQTRSGPTVAALIAAARVRHWSFTDVGLADGAVLLFLNQRQRTLLAEYGPEIEGLVGTSAQYTLARSGTAIVASNDSGSTLYATTYQDGFAVHVDPVTQDLYIDTSETPLASDPFGQSGGTPGFPLPADFVRLTNVALSYTDNTVIPCDVIEERARFTVRPGRNPMAFVSGNRLVPVLPLATGNTGDRWFSVLAIQLSYVAMQTLASLTDMVTLPTVLCEALTADIAALLAMQSRTCPATDRAAFQAQAAQAAARCGAASIDLIDSVQHSSVLYRG